MLIQKAAMASVTVASVLIAVKFLAWWFTGAISLKATLIDSLLDALASLMNLVAVHQSHQPANKQFRFGYGKVEAIAALGQSVFIAGSACWLTFEAIERFFKPIPIQAAVMGILVMIFAMGITFMLLIYQYRVVKKTDSPAIRADALHYRSDFLINGGVILSLLAAQFYDVTWVDPLSGAIIGLYIFYTAWKLTRDGFYILMDHELPEKDRQQIIALALSHPQVKGLHELRTRTSGLKRFIQLHLELDGSLTLSEANVIAVKVDQIIFA
ncbi:MAG: cation diffusion facilitator family transporter, partial [Alphaproteobacteria bacterium]|nr:cation diffusion facilitator family transporter [Alphaproteobacteria bacterium]